ncbi:LuxR C-terminal-related transcriptional regulator [Chryseobacterium carnipullorum]|uniref:LuxR C-terminal-related transcriptional regulator n=1 Tax=Chryseobacterium carnipullorum TaxID=1124835 RepID=UPI0009181E79|nr:LuxR C-terminal-related transcriptional regulator [Chryseobacterium carnipullorum]SHL29482.1 Tetratricopeptide repeat-containing protein [Chryseobacterium carnipullorum]HBV17362.1 tetratricopeptide repeat protein [Chryseobacterium carnipullorum]
MKNFSFLLILLLFSCKNREDGNKYFDNLKQEIEKKDHSFNKLTNLKKLELKKYSETKNKLYKLSSEYIDMHILSKKENYTKVSKVYELLKLNDGEYEFLISECNFELAIYLEHSSPKLAMQFLDKAIKVEEKLPRKYFLPHLYHVKGRLYYNEGNYQIAMKYFDKALHLFGPNEILFIASMHNNFGLVYSKLGNYEQARREAEIAINILKGKPLKTEEEKDFVHLVNSHLGFYLYKLKKYNECEEYLRPEIQYYLNKPFFYKRKNGVMVTLFDLYKKTNEKRKMMELINYLIEIEPRIKGTENIITCNEVILRYYLELNNNTETVKHISEKLIRLNHQLDEENYKNISNTSYFVADQAIKYIDNKYEYELSFQEKINILITVIFLLLLLISIIMLVAIKNRNKKDKLIFEQKSRILEHNVNMQKNKIKSMHQNIYLKTKIEEDFLKDLRKIKQSNDVDSEQLLRDLYLKVQNLRQIDKKNNLYISESNHENEAFLCKLSKQYPSLTNRELKLCNYFLINLSAKEISSLEGISEGTIRVYKTKIRRKLNISKAESLDKILKKF